MADFTAKDVQALRQATGAGMMDAKKALTETDGDMDAAKKLLREKGLAKADDRSGRENAQGAIAVATNVGTVGMVELKCETDFVAKSENFIHLTQELADSVAAEGEAGGRRAPARHRRPQGHAQGEHRGRRRGADQAVRRRDRRHLPAPPGGPRRQRRGRRAAGRHEGARPRHRRAHRLRQAAVPVPRRGPRGRGGRGARDAAQHHQGRGQARGRRGRRSSRGASPAGTKSACSSTRRSSATTS